MQNLMVFVLGGQATGNLLEIEKKYEAMREKCEKAKAKKSEL